MDGPRNPARHHGRAPAEMALQNYLVNEIQEVYRLQGVQHQRQTPGSHLPADDALGQGRGHVGDSEFLPEEVVDKFKFR